jgi:hypothetical protein
LNIAPPKSFAAGHDNQPAQSLSLSSQLFYQIGPRAGAMLINAVKNYDKTEVRLGDLLQIGVAKQIHPPPFLSDPAVYERSSDVS